MNLEPGESKKFELEVPGVPGKSVLVIDWTCGGCHRQQTLKIPVCEPVTENIEANIQCYICDAPVWLRPYRRLLGWLGFRS